MRPAQAWEPREVVIQGHPHRVVLDREGRVLGVRDEVASCVAVPAQSIDDVPVTRPWRHPDNSFGAAEGGDLVEGRAERSGDRKDPRVGQDPDHPTEHDIRQREQFGPGDRVLEPAAQPRVPFGIVAKRSDQHVDVRNDHWE